MMLGAIEMNNVMMIIMFTILAIAAAGLIVVSMLEQPFMTAEECTEKGGVACAKGYICSVRSIGVVKDGNTVGACCPASCVEG